MRDNNYYIEKMQDVVNFIKNLTKHENFSDDETLDFFLNFTLHLHEANLSILSNSHLKCTLDDYMKNVAGVHEYNESLN